MSVRRFFSQLRASTVSESDDVVLNWNRGANQVFGPVTRQYLDTFEKHDEGSGKLQKEALIKALNQLDLYPSKSQVYSMIKSASECSGREVEDHVTFGEFCVFASFLKDNYNHEGAYYHPKDCLHPESRPGSPSKRAVSSVISNFEGENVMKHMCADFVFLGGSCNPTTWRQDTAIPLLKQYSLTYYNPQVTEWGPDLIEIEDQAKNIAQLLMFVIDNTTRSVASLVEAAYFAGSSRPLVLIMKGLPNEVDGETLTEKELEDLSRGHDYLCDLTERQWTPIFENLEAALHCTAKVLNQKVPIWDLEISDGAQPVKHPHVRVDSQIINIKETFREYLMKEYPQSDEERILLTDALLAIRSITGKELSFPAYNKIVQSCAESGERNSFDFNEFCCLVTEYKHYEPKNWAVKVFRNVQNWWNQVPRPIQETVEPKRDVFLGGSCNKCSWREDIAIPILRKNGLSYFNPQLQRWNLRYMPIEVQAKENAHYLLYVISDESRAAASMVEVSHYIGKRRIVYMCCQNLKDGVEIYGETLTPRAVKDYNRGRCYLTDLASRQGVPIFEDIQETVEALVQRIKEDRTQERQEENGKS